MSAHGEDEEVEEQTLGETEEALQVEDVEVETQLLSGASALVTVANYFYEQMSVDERFEQAVADTNLAMLAGKLRDFFGRVFWWKSLARRASEVKHAR
jgi:hypothetical protein